MDLFSPYIPLIAEFPTPHAVEAPVTVNFFTAEFSTRLWLVDYSKSRDEHRKILNGIYFYLANSTLALMATDGRRLARSCQPAGEGSGSFILPARSKLELFRLLSAADSLSFSWSEWQVSFSVTFPDNFSLKRAFLLSKVVEGTYPNYQ
jgi:DNA polymerase-3 subunit beta